MSKEQIYINSMDDVSIARNNEFINLHLYTGQLIQVSREVLKAVNKQLFPLLPASNGEKKVGVIEECEAIRDLKDLGLNKLSRMSEWPNGVINAPIWRSSDNRVMSVTHMDDRYLANAKRKVEQIASDYPETKNIMHYRQWSTWFKLEQQRRRYGR